MGIKRKRRLIENAVPTIFSFTSEKKRRESSMKLCVQEAMFDLPGSSQDEEQMCCEITDNSPPCLEKCIGTEVRTVDKCVGENVVQNSIKTQCDPLFTGYAWGDKNFMTSIESETSYP